LDKKESPISQREKELLEKEAKIIEFENMVRETVLRAKQVNLNVIYVKSLLNLETHISPYSSKPQITNRLF